MTKEKGASPQSRREKQEKQEQREKPADKPGQGQKVALALGSGGARGYAHIGVIEVLEEQGYEITAITGSSMGALIGGVYATGNLRAYKDWVTGLDQFDLFRLLDFSLKSPGAIRGDKVFSRLEEMIGDTRIEDLSIAYTAIATDLLAHKEVWFQKGLLRDVIRASIAIPSVITPVMMQGRVLVDGGLLNPVPIIPTMAAYADIILAVNLSGNANQHPNIPPIEEWEDEAPSVSVNLEEAEENEEPDRAEKSQESRSESEPGKNEEWLERLKQTAARWFETESGSSGRDAPKSEEQALAMAQAREKQKAVREGREHSEEVHSMNLQELGLGKFDVMNLAIETMQQALTRHKMASYPPDILINFPKHVCKAFDYHKAPEIIQLGRLLAEEALEEYRNSGTTQSL
ncbi:MAG: patatin-like phospholipase family protein [Oleiphilaceae bacterium]|nr:patatin-like phospholipase family protein [Oleiphilaceae bacterium]